MVTACGAVVRVRLEPGYGAITLDLFNEHPIELPEVGQAHAFSFPPHTCWPMAREPTHCPLNIAPTSPSLAPEL
jgi:hypothetical protein